MIAKGSYGSVYKYQDSLNNKMVAVKIISTNSKENFEVQLKEISFVD